VRPVVACVTDRPLLAQVDRAVPGRMRLTLGQPAPLRLNSGGRIVIMISADFVDRASTAENSSDGFLPAGYFFQISEQAHREILAYHWHPDGRSRMTTPHLHVSSRLPLIQLSENSTVSLSDMHLPTGVVTIQEIVRLLIVEFQVEPRRSDWDAILALR
jgi:hypothetical protein